MNIGRQPVGPGHPVYIIAEIGVNHDGSIDRALKLVDAAADAGADAVKTQYFRADDLMSRAAKLAAYQSAAGESDPIDMLRRLELSLDDMARVIEHAHARNLHAIVTPFTLEHVPAVAQLPWDAFKSASPDIINWPLLRALASTGRPMIVSTGAATRAEVASTFDAFLDRYMHETALLQCVSCYPTPRENAAIAAMLDIDLGDVVGYSDHTNDLDIGALAVRIGASILEKHLTYNRTATGPDHAASLDPQGFTEYVRLARQASQDANTRHATNELLAKQPRGSASQALLTDLSREKHEAEVREALASDPAYGPPEKRVLQCEQDVRTVSRQSLTTTRELPAGHRITRDDLTIKRPGTGIEPFRLDEAIDQTTTRPVEADTPLVDDDLR